MHVSVKVDEISRGYQWFREFPRDVILPPPGPSLINVHQRADATFAGRFEHQVGKAEV